MEDTKTPEEFLPNRDQLLDAMGRPLTQSLFLEIGYSDAAVYTLKDIDHIYNGKTYPSLKRLFLSTNDPTEYQFAVKYLLGWKHWMRLCENKVLKGHFEEWRIELEVKIRSEALARTIEASQAGTYSATKYLADRGWDVRPAGRPTELEKAKHLKMEEKLNDEYGADVIRMIK